MSVYRPAFDSAFCNATSQGFLPGLLGIRILEIGQGLAWIPIRDGAAFTILGLLFLAVGLACAVWADRHKAPRTSTARL